MVLGTLGAFVDAIHSCESQMILCQNVTRDSVWKASGSDIRKELSHIDDDIYVGVTFNVQAP